MDSHEIKILTERLIPVPQEISFRDGAEYLLQDGCRMILNLDGTARPVARAQQLAEDYWKIFPSITVCAAEKKLGPEAYQLEITETELTITADDEAGMLNAFKTLRQLAEVQRGTKKVSGYFLVQCSIHDKPAMPFRGIHFCIFPETPLWDIEKQLRLAAYHKFNYAVIETWGVFPFESHPEMGWADRKISRLELKRLIRLGRELGITLIPQFNLLGHASASRSITGKHAILDYNPALQPLFEPEGWTWCLTNPETRRILTDLVLELDEFYEHPPLFHLGCDVADNIGTCRNCRRKVLKDLVKDHIRYFRDLLAKQGARVIMWHDMLLKQGDPRWKDYIVCGLPEHKLDQLYKELPRDIIIADWQYGEHANPEDKEQVWPTMQFFQQEKFDVLGCPWQNAAGTLSIGKYAERSGMFGMLETTWHIYHDSRHCHALGITAAAAWNPEKAHDTTLALRLAVAQHMRQVGWDMNIVHYEQTGWSQDQVDPGKFPNQPL